MPSIDERVVSMSFENARFEAGVAQTMTTLTKLNTAIANTGTGPNGLANIENAANKVTLQAPMSALDKLKAKLGRTNSGTTFTDMEHASDKVTLEQPTKALDNLKGKLDRTNAGATFSDMEKAADRISFNGLLSAIDGVKGHLSGLETAASVALGNIASQAAMKGAAFGKSFAFGPIKQGFEEYQTNLNAIQTTLANTQGQRVTGLGNVNKYLAELNKYSDKTIYNFGEMAKNIGTFTAAGVSLPKSTEAIKGIANLAALSGSNSQQASTAMYQLSQAISSGKVGLQDWNSVVNAGMGGAVFQKSLMRTAENMGTIEKGALKVDKATGKATINGESFRDSISGPGPKWLTSDVLTNTLSQLTGDMSDAELKAKGFTDEQIKAIQAQAKTAQNAATQVKTLPQVFDVARETIGSGWSKTFQTIFGDFGESKKTFTELSQTINGFINTNANARNKVLDAWKALGGRTELIQGIKNIFNVLIDVLSKVKDAFREVFPATTGKDLADITKRFLVFTAHLNNSPETINNIARTFKGFFAVLHIGWTIVKDVGKVLFDLLGVVGKGSGGLLNFTGGIGDFLVGLDKAISKGNALGGFFKGLENILRVPLELIKAIASGIGSLFGGFDGSKAGDIGSNLDGMNKALTPMDKLVGRVKEAWKQFSGVLDQFKTIVDPWFQQVKEQFSKFGDIVAQGIKDADFNKVLLAFQTVFLGGIFMTLKKAIGGGKSLDITGGLFKNISDTFGALTGQLTAMQQKVKAQVILEIAGAVVVLAAGVFILSTIDPKRLASAMTAVAVGLGELGAALKLMESGKFATVAMPLIAGSMLILAVAVVILAAAMKIFATMSWEELAKGLAGVGGALAVIAAGVNLMPAAKILPVAAGLLVLGIALNIIAIAVKIFSEMKWEDMAKGLLGLGGALVVLALGMSLIGPSILVTGPGLIAAALGMTLLAGAVGAFGSMKFEDIVKGLLGAGTALALLGSAMVFIPPTIGVQAAGLILLGIGLTALAGAISVFGNMKVSTLAKGIIAMGAALVVLGVGLLFMEGTLPGSIALLAAAAGLAILAPTLAFMGNLSWGTIIKGLAAMALTIGVIAAVGALAAPALLSLGAALVVMGLGLVLIGTAVFIAAKGLSLLGENGAKGLGVLVAAIGAFIALLPTMVINFVKGLVSIFEEIAKVAPKVVLALGTILETVFKFIIDQAPKLGEAVTALITAIVTVLAKNAGPLITAGWKLVQQLLTGIANNIGSVAVKVGEIIKRFLDALTKEVPRIVQSGAKLLTSFLGGIINALPKLADTVGRLITKFIDSVTKQIPKIVASGAHLITQFLNSVANQVGKVIAAGARIIIKFLDGIGDAIPRIKDKALEVARKFLNSLADGLAKLADIGFRAIIRFLNGLARAIRENSQDLANAGANVANAIIDAMTQQFGKLGPVLRHALEAVFRLLPGWARKILGISSPSKVFMEIGKYTMLGFSKGVDDNHQPVLASVEDLTTDLIEHFNDTGRAAADGLSQGLMASSTAITNAATGVGDDAASALTLSLANISDRVKAEVDTNITITPVLDLSRIRQDSGKIGNIVGIAPIVANTSFGQAAAISTGTEEAAREVVAVTPAAQSFRFEQNNYSPDPLSNIEIYRQTNNQLSRIKSLVNVQ